MSQPTYRVLRTIALAAALMLGACQAGPEPNARASDGGNRGAIEGVVKGVALPPVTDADQLRPLVGDALARARKSLEQILAEIAPPDYLQPDAEPEAADAPDDADALDEPPLDAQHAYAAGRQAWHDRNTYQAINQLERALGLAPDQPAILRMLAEIYTEAGNHVRAAMYLRRAVEIEPAHVPSLLQLGRFALEQGRADEAIHILHHALTLTRRDPAHQNAGGDPTLRPLLHHHLARALRRVGYAAAAIDQYHRYREALPEGPLRYGPGAQELMALEHQAPLSWQAIGHLHHQLGEPVEAREAYRRAITLAEQREQTPGTDLVGQLIYTHLLLGETAAAGELTVEHVHRTEADDQTLALVRYLSEQGAGGDALGDSLRTVYQREGRPASLALAAADLLGGDAGHALLREHLETRPEDARVFEGLMHRLLPERVTEAMRVAAGVMAAHPAGAEARAHTLFEAAGGAGALLEAFEALPEAERDGAMMRVLRGLALMEAGRTTEAGELLRVALDDDPELDAARLALARVAIRHGDDAQADALLAPLAERGEPGIVRLRVRVLERRGELDEALALLEQHLARDGARVELILQKAQLQLRADRVEAAERTLLDALNAHPEDERIYAALLEMYDPGGGRQPAVDDAQVQYQRLVRRLLGTIPDSRLGRLVRANLMAARREFAEAEQLLRTMLEANPMDVEVIEELLRLYMQSNQPEAAAELIGRTVEAHPHQHELLILAMRFYREMDDAEGALAVGERLLALEPTDIDLVSVLVSLFIWVDRPDKGVEAVEHALAAEHVRQPVELASLLARAMRQDGRGEVAADRLNELAERFDEHAADIHCELALLLDGIGQPDRAERVLLDTLEAHPEHPRVNNALGYTWADRDQHLERAKEMIEIAVEAEPDSAAYLDSLGWVYYKLGDFEAAVHWLERSRAANGGDHPVILDHLGDAYYRLGDHDRAQRYWSRAAMRLSRIATPEHYAELDGLDERLRAKLQALEADEQPPVAHSPGADDEQAD